MKKMTTIRYYAEYAKLTLKNIVLSSLLSSARVSRDLAACTDICRFYIDR